MLGWVRRWPAYALNGVTVGAGVGLIQLSFGALTNAEVAQAASTGAVLASLPHLTGRASPTWRRTLIGGLLAALATFVVLLTAPHPFLRGLVVAQIAFVALLGMAFGTKAGPMVFSVIIGIVFAMARPSADGALRIALASAAGVVAYSAWAYATAKLLEARYRVLAVAATLDASGALLAARARVLMTEHPDDDERQQQARFAQLSEEVALAQVLQNARDLVFPARSGRGVAQSAAILARVSELREIVLTSRLDLDLLGDDGAARFTRARLAVALRRLGVGLVELASALRERRPAELRTHDWARELPDMQEAAQMLEGDARARLLPLISSRLRYLTEEVEAIRSLVQGSSERHSLSPAELSSSVSDDDTWPVRVVLEHLTLSSPVLRHAVRSALALATVYFVARALPWATRPHWMLLSVAVVLRGTLDDTLSRRNFRVLGTAIGCVLVAVLLSLVSDAWLMLVFVIAVGTAHAFVNVRYLLTAIAATLMALLQAHFASPHLGFLVAERLLDTVIGALVAWAFSYVLPSWERRSLPSSIERMLAALRVYAEASLTLDGARPEQRLARQRAYDALGVVSAALRRSAAEPERVRPPVRTLVTALDHAQRLMAHLSSVRTLLSRRASRLPVAETSAALTSARERLQQRLSLSAPADTSKAPSIPELPADAVERDPLPWLERRLQACLYDARLAGSAAREALSALSFRGRP